MSRFLAGFFAASLLWGGVLFASARGYIDLGLSPAAEPEAGAVADASEAIKGAPKAKRKRSGSVSGSKRPRAGLQGDSMTGDDLGENDPRRLDMNGSGSEAQLAGSEIEKGFDSVFSQVRRCLILAASDEPAQGKLIFGLRIAGSGNVKAVNLSGPSSVTQGESGACLRKAASSIHFRAFGGPDMVVHYPLTLE